MPKDATKNIDRYKIRGGSLNEYEYAENQAALADQNPSGQTNLIPGTPPEQKMEELRPQIKAAAKKTTKKSVKATKSTKTAKAAKQSAKAAKKATKATKASKQTAKAKKSPKGGNTKSSTRGASAKKLAARKAAKKR